MFKLLLPCLFILFYSIQVSAQTRINADLYRINDQYFDVVKLKYETVEGILADDFKSSSKYKTRFAGLSIDQVGYRGTLFRLLEDNGLLATNLETSAANPVINNEKGIPRRGQNYLLKVNSGVVHIKNLKDANGYLIYQYDQDVKEGFAVQLQHSEYVERGKLKYHLPYLKYKTHTGSSIVFTSYIDRIPKTVVVSTSNGAISNFDFTCIGIIRDEEMDMDIHGFVKHKKGSSQLDITYIAENFSITRDYFANANVAETLLLGNKLIIATYNDMKNGVQLLAVDTKSKAVIWEAKVNKLTDVPAQYFFNMVWLSERKGHLLLEGYESGGRYLQIFDTTTGKQLWKSF